MKIFLIILGVYLITCFLSRYLNKVIYMKRYYSDIEPFIWFVPVINIVAIFVYLSQIVKGYRDKKGSNFFGDNWYELREEKEKKLRDKQYEKHTGKNNGRNK